MIATPKPPSHDGLEALIREARERQLRRRLLGAAGVAIAAALGLSAYALTIGGKPGNAVEGEADAGRASAPLCRSSQLSASATFQGATQTMLGGVTIVNTSDAACVVPLVRPQVAITWHGNRLPTRERAMSLPTGSSAAGALAPGAKAGVLWRWWSCGRPGSRAAVRPAFVLRFGHGLVVKARSDEVTPVFCGDLAGGFLDVSRPLTEN